MTTSTRPSQKTALITGCSSGIGHALALEFATSGYRVIATARNTEALVALGKQHPNIIAAFLDVQKPESIAAVKEEILKLTKGQLDYLVNNAGAHYASTALDVDVAKIREVFDINVVAVMLMCREFADFLIAAKGIIVQIGSVTRNVPVVWQSPYNASKAALSQYTKTLRLEVEPFGVRVIEVVTAYVQSDILRNGLYAPAESRYLPIKDHIQTLKNNGNKNGMPSSTYAHRIVSQVTRPRPPRELWDGSQAWQLWFVVTWIPAWLQNMLWRRLFRLDRLH